MIKHLVKLTWNKRKKNALLITEILVSFLVLFGVFTFLVNSWKNYKQPIGFDYRKIWVVNYNNPIGTKNLDSLNQFYTMLRDRLKAMPEIEDLTWTSANFPFSQSTTNNSVHYKGKQYSDIDHYTIREHYVETMGMRVLEGRTFSVADQPNHDRLLVVNKAFKDRVFGGEPAVGKVLRDQDGELGRTVIGVVNDVKYKGDYQPAKPASYSFPDSTGFRWLGNILIRLRPSAGAAFESRLHKLLANSLRGANIEIEHLSDKLVSTNKFTLVPLIVFSIIGTFLMINVALGLFGVLWYNISRRRAEIGLRRAIGASGGAVSRQLVAESFVLATFALTLGTFFAVQFPLLNVLDVSSGVYLAAILFSIVFIYLLVFVCSFYPGKQAAAIYPAVALHEE